jgi:ABC-type antimicrobial peptide transport system permease subunit
MSFPDSQGTSEQRITEEVDFFISDFVNEHFSEVQNVFNDIEDYTRYIKYNTKDSENKYHPGKTYDYFYNLAITSLINKQGFSDINSSLEIEIEYDTRVPVEIVGVYLNSYDYELINYDTVFLSDEVYGNLVDTYDLDGYPILSAILSGDYKKDIGIINYLYDHEINYPCYDFYNDIIYSVKSAKMILLLLSSVFGGLAVLMTIFVSLIIYNYMIVSIQLKQKNIGIMRALGAKKKNIFLIFYSESIILAAINIVIALFGSFIASLSINYFLIKGYLKFSFSVLSYGIFNISAIVILALIIASLSTIPPILKFSKKQPIDIIKGII